MLSIDVGDEGKAILGKLSSAFVAACDGFNLTCF
jgi:hypothetical protein